MSQSSSTTTPTQPEIERVVEMVVDDYEGELQNLAAIYLSIEEGMEFEPNYYTEDNSKDDVELD